MWDVDNKIPNERHMKIRIFRGFARAPGTWAQHWWLIKFEWVEGRKKERAWKKCMVFGLSMLWGGGEWGMSLIIMFMWYNVPRASKKQEANVFSVNIVGNNHFYHTFEIRKAMTLICRLKELTIISTQ